MRLLIAMIAVLALAPCMAQPQPKLLNACDDLAGWSVGWGKELPDSKLELNTDPQFISEGKASLHASSVSPKDATGNVYLSVVLITPPVDFRQQALLFEAWTTDPQITRALYVRGFDAQGNTVLSWQSWLGPLKTEPTTIEVVPGVSLGLLQWEPAEIKSDDYSAVVRWEFFVGTSKPGAAFDLYLDNIRLVPSEVKPFMATTEARPLQPQTPLLENGEPAFVVYAPADPAWQAATDELLAGLEEALGKRPQVIVGDSAEARQAPATHALMLGNVGNNRAMLYPYSHYMMTADANFPGAGGYELRTVCDPWGDDCSAIIIGASDPAGAKTGVAAFLEHVRAASSRDNAVVLPRLFEVKPSEEARGRYANAFQATLDEEWLKGQQEVAQKALEEGAHTGLFGTMASVGSNYIVSGRDEFATLFVWLARAAKAFHDTKPTTYGGPWGMDSDFMGHQVLPMWAYVEQSPALTDQDRLDVSRILFQYIEEAALPEGAGAAMGAQAGASVSNHGTFAALATFVAGEYFSKYYDAGEGKQWIAIGDQCFTNMAKLSKAHEDCNGYQWLTNVHVMRYALTKPDLTVFENGNARTIADYAIITMNNLGYQVPYGDTGAWVCWFSELPVLRMAEWFYRDGTYRWCVDKKVEITGRKALWEYEPSPPGPLSQGERGSTTAGPSALARFLPVPLDRPWYDAEGGAKSGVPFEKTCDKIAFRDSFDPKGAFLLLDGLSNGGHRHMDGNSILQWTENDRVWIADADYIKSLPKYHNGVLILKDGQSATIPDFVEVEHVSDLPSAAVSVTTYRNYAGVDWRRNVIWLKGRMFIVADQMVAKEPGDYSFRAIWRTVGNAKLNGNAMDVEQGGQWARFATTPDARVTLDDDALTGANWSSYPYAGKPVVRVMQDVTNRKMNAGDSLTLFTVLQASGDKSSMAELHRVEDNTAIVTGAGEPVEITIPWRVAEAPALFIGTPSAVFAVGAKEITGRDGTKVREFPQGADLETNAQSGATVALIPAGQSAQLASQKREEFALRDTMTKAEIEKTFEESIAAAKASVQPTTPQTVVPSLKPLWSYAEKLDSYLLTNNADTFEGVDAGVKLSCSPQPLPQNVFAQDKTNTLDNLVDGALLTTDGGVMWGDDQRVTVDLALDNTYDLQRLSLKAWFATSSSKNKLYQLGSVQAFASNDGFRQDNRKLGELTDTEEHGNWGRPAYGPQSYDLPIQGKAKQVRLVLTPRPGTAIYLAEVQLWGNRPGLELDMAKKQAAGAPTHVFQALKWADINGDGNPELLAGSSNGMAYCFGSDGKIAWKTDCGAPVNDIAAVDFAGDGKLTVVAGCMNSRLVALDANGKELWVFTPEYYKEPAHFRVVFPADLQGDGKQAVIAGADNWHYYAVDANGQELWKYESVHGSTAGTAADLEGDRKDEIIAGTEYYWWHVINADGQQRFSFSVNGPTANAVAAGDADGDGKQEVFFGGADTMVHCLTEAGEKRWTFNTGDEVQALHCADVNGDGKTEVLVGSLSFNLYCLDGAGRMLWRRDLGSPVKGMAAVKPGVLAAGCADGTVHVHDTATGEPRYQYAAKAEVLKITAHSAGVAVSTGDGNLTVLGVP